MISFVRQMYFNFSFLSNMLSVSAKQWLSILSIPRMEGPLRKRVVFDIKELRKYSFNEY